MDFWLFMGGENKDIKSTELQLYYSFFLDIFLNLKYDDFTMKFKPPFMVSHKYLKNNILISEKGYFLKGEKENEKIK